MTELNSKGGLALILAAVLNITRMIPVFVNERITTENFPPKTVELTIYVSQLYGWHVSHIMALVSVPLLAFGLVALYCELKERGTASQGLAVLVGGLTAMVLYLSGAILDGLALPAVVRHVQQAYNAGDQSAGHLISLVHLTATSFGGFGAVVLLVTMLFVGVGMLRGFGNMIMGAIGIFIGAVSLIGFSSGLINLNIAESLPIVGPLSIGMFVYLIAIGVMLMPIPLVQAADI